MYFLFICKSFFTIKSMYIYKDFEKENKYRENELITPPGL